MIQKHKQYIIYNMFPWFLKVVSILFGYWMVSMTFQDIFMFVHGFLMVSYVFKVFSWFSYSLGFVSMFFFQVTFMVILGLFVFHGCHGLHV